MLSQEAQGNPLPLGQLEHLVGSGHGVNDLGLENSAPDCYLHTIRAFAVRPWHESLKEPGAFAMVTFHVGEKDGKNAPDPKAPLLTGNRPKGKYPKGEAHKVMLDFLVRNCPVADKDVPDSCRVRYRIDERPEVTLTKEEAVWLTDLPPGKHLYVVALTKDGKIIEGPFNLYRGSFEIVDEAGAAPAASQPKAGAPTP